MNAFFNFGTIFASQLFRMMKKFAFRVVTGLFLFSSSALFSSCNKLKAEEIKTDFQAWINDILTPRETTLEKVNSGYSVKGNLKNRPNNLVMLLEVSGEGMQILDSSRTNSNGDFELSGNVKEAIICQLQWEENSGVYMVVDNNTNARVELSGSGPDISYTLSGKGIEASADMKALIDLNTKYILQLQNIQELAQRLPQTEESYAEAARLQQQYYAQLGERKEAIRNMALGLKKSIIPYFVVASGMLEELDFKLLEHALNAAKGFSETSKYTKDMQSRFDQEKTLTIGAVAPDIKLKQPDGKEMSLSSLRGKVVLIDFWASWCGPCRRENPFNRQLYAQYKNKGFEIFGVSLDQEAGRWKGAIAADSLSWYHVSDLGGWNSSPAKLYKVSSIPATYLLDKEGKIIAKGLRGEQLQAKLEEVFSK